MSFLGDLPSIPSSRFSRKDIELFNKYRKRYKKTVKEIKDILAHTQTTIDIDSIRTNCCPEFTEALIENNLRELHWNDYQKCDDGNILCDPYAVPIKKGFNGKKMLHYSNTKTYIKEFECYRSRVNYLNDFIILALYIPEELEWLRLYLGTNCRGSRRSTLGLIGYYEKGNFPFKNGSGNGEERIDLSLEAILERSKDYSFLDEKTHNFNLEVILEDSKKRFIIPDGYGEETMIINGEKYKRVVLVHPGLPIKGGISNPGIYIEAPEETCVHIEGIYLNSFSSDGRISLNYKDNLYFSYLGPVGLDLSDLQEYEIQYFKAIRKEYRMLSFHKYQIDEIIE